MIKPQVNSRPNLVIHVKGLRKSYGDNEVIAGIDLEVKNGEIFALLGPNGAGKTTTVEILEGYRNRNSGEINVLGYNPYLNQRKFKERIGIVLQKTGVEPYLTVEETINLFSGYYLHPYNVEEIIQVTGLTEIRKVKVKKLSGGQQRRLDVAIGLAGDPELLFLDEPTTGFDPVARRNAWEMIKNLQKIGKTIFLTTHYMDEAEYLADHIALIVKGTIIAEGSPKQLIGLNSATLIRFRINKFTEDLLKIIPNITESSNGLITIQTDTPEKILFELTRWAIKKEIALDELSVSKPSLEDTYLRLVNQGELELNK